MKVYSPNKSYTGVTASVPFCNGQGETDDPYLLKWFEKHGYEVEKPAAPRTKGAAGTRTAGGRNNGRACSGAGETCEKSERVIPWAMNHT